MKIIVKITAAMAAMLPATAFAANPGTIHAAAQAACCALGVCCGMPCCG
jgi:hypothetical protein